MSTPVRATPRAPMTQPELSEYLFFVGACVQFCGAVLLAVLFWFLRRYAGRRGYFASWTRAWVVLSVALVAVLLLNLPRMLGEPSFAPASAQRATLLFAYQFSKLLYAALIVSGTRVYAFGAQPRAAYLWAVAGSAALALAHALVLAPLGVGAAVFQSPFIVLAFGYASATLLGMPASRRSLGSRTTGTFFGLMAATWALYGMVRLGLGESHVPQVGGAARLFVLTNTYIDALLQLLLGCGMVVLLMEDAKREADDAHAELAVAHDKLRRDALYDSLTGSLNRRAFDEGVGLEMARATFGAVIVLDMDNLKTVNDSLGHAAGDELLQHLATTLRAVIRPSDRLYRWGGDEFLLVFPNAKHGDVIGRVESAIVGSAPLDMPGAARPVQLVASVGGADYASGDDLMQAIERADGVMYRQKKTRRARTRDSELTPAMAHPKFVKAEDVPPLPGANAGKREPTG